MTDPNIVACLKERLLIAQTIHNELFGEAVMPEGLVAAYVPGVLAVYDRLVAALTAGYTDDPDDEMLDDLIVPAAKEPW